MKIPIVTIVGKPNVGKSTFFNRMAGVRKAIISDIAGTTRDRIFQKIEHEEIDYVLVDTGGIEFGKKETSIEDDIQTQAKIAMEDSDLIIFMVSGKDDMTSEDFRAAELLRKQAGQKPTLLVVSKCDQALDESTKAEFFQLGLGEPLAISAIHNTGVLKLESEVIKLLKSRHFLVKNSDEYKAAEKLDKANLNVALVGKPNVGKSSLINALLNQDKLIVSEIAGTTRDATDSLIKHKSKVYNFIDTAGLRRKGKIEKGIEKYSALRTLSAIERSDVGILVIDSSKPIAHQDQTIASEIIEAGKGLMIVANKWDIKDDEEKEEQRRASFVRKLKQKFAFLPWSPAVFTSAVTKKNLSKIFEQLDGIKKEREKRIPTSSLNNYIEQVIEDHKPTGTKTIKPKLFYVTQVASNPPHFVFFVNKKKYFHFSYLRYLENKLREKYSFLGTPIKMEYQEKEMRYSKKK